MTTNMITATRGSDVLLQLTWRAPSGDPIDLTGMTVKFLDQTGLSGRLSHIIVDALLGRMNVSIEGTDPIRVGIYQFRVQIIDAAGLSIASPAITLRVI